MIRFKNTKNIWLYFVLLASAVLLLGEVINGRFTMHDLEVYYRTAERMMQGEQLYRIDADGHYVYKYSPTAAMYFIPFALLPFPAAKFIFWALLTALTIVVLNILFQLTGKAYPSITDRTKNILLLAFLAVGAHVHREWHLGQVNFILLSLYVFMLHALLAGKNIRAGIFLAVSLFLKPFGLIFFPYLLLRAKYKTICASLVAVVVLALLPMVFYPSWQQYVTLNQNWLTELSIELGAKQNLLADANHTIFSVLARFTPAQYILSSPAAVKVYQLLILAIIGISMIGFMKMRANDKYGIIAEISVLTALIPLFAFTSQNAFLFTLPAIIVVLYNYSSLSAFSKALAVTGCLLIGANIRDLMGKEFYNILENASVYTFGTIILLAVIAQIRWKAGKQQHSLEENRKSTMHA